MNKLKQNLKVGLASLLLLGATVAAQAQTYWANRGSDWGEPAANAFDGSPTTKWSQQTASPAQSGWIGGSYTAPVKFNQLIITSTSDGYYDAATLGKGVRDFKNWTLKASNDTLAGWVDLNTQTNIQFTGPTTSQTFNWVNETAYKYYRFYFINNGNGYTQVAELALSYVVPVPPEVDMFWSDRDGSGFSGTKEAGKAFDGILTTAWSQQVASPPGAGVITARYAMPKKFNKVEITNFDDGYGDEGQPANQTPRSFKSWVLKASNDTVAGWTTLDTRTNEVFLKPLNKPRVTNPYTFANNMEYKYYRFEFVNNGNSYVQMAELAFSFVAPPEVDMFWSDRDGSGFSGTKEAGKAFDGILTTAWSQQVASPPGAGTITARYAIPKKFNKVDITNFDDGYGDEGQPANQTPRSFKSWVLKASNDTLAGWTTLDTRTNEVFLKPLNKPRVTNTYTFANNMDYKYYRFEFVNNGNSYVQMGELAFSFVAPPEVDMFWSDRDGSGFSGTKEAGKAFDGILTTAWSQQVASPPGAGKITARYAIPKKFNKVEITNFDDGYGDDGQPANQTPRSFKSWVLKASNDTVAGWTTLDTRTNEVFLKPLNKPRVTNTYTFANNMDYKYYRFEFVNNGNSFVQMAELAFSFVAPPEVDMFWSDRDGSGFNGTGDKAAKAFDGFKSTPWSQQVTDNAGVITARYAMPKKFNKVNITNNEDLYGDGGLPANQTPRAFKNWVLKASNDTLAGWTTLDTRTNEVFLKPTGTGPARATNSYSFSNEVFYKYYRFDFVNNGNSYVQMNEIGFLDTTAVLPLTSLKLTGTESNGGARLVWNTKGEVNVASYDVLKQDANGVFVKITNVKAKANGDNTYSFFDANAALGNNYYQIKNIDTDGSSTTTSNVISVKVSNLESATSIYPNPANNGLVNVVASGAVESVTIYSVSNGIKFISKKFNGSNKSVQIDIQSLAKGVYIVEVSSKLSVTRKKLIVN